VIILLKKIFYKYNASKKHENELVISAQVIASMSKYLTLLYSRPYVQTLNILHPCTKQHWIDKCFNDLVCKSGRGHDRECYESDLEQLVCLSNKELHQLLRRANESQIW